jgi:hypothetical protein
MILTVPDPDAVFASALAAGAREVVAVHGPMGGGSADRRPVRPPLGDRPSSLTVTYDSSSDVVSPAFPSAGKRVV